MWLLKFLNDNAGAFNVLFGAIVAVATVIYAVLTRSLVQETQRLRVAQTEPQVAVWIEPSEHWINLIDIIIQNSGSTPALDVRLSSEPDFETRQNEHLSDFGLFKHGIRVLAPGQRIKNRLAIVTGQIEEIERPDGKFSFVVTARYKSVIGQEYDQRFPIDFRHLVGLRQSGTPPLHSMAKALQDIQQDVHRLASGFAKLRVIRQTQDEVRQEDEEALQEYRRRKADASTEASE